MALACANRRLAALLLLACCAAAPAAAQQASDPPSAVILVYHRFGEDDVPSTNIRLDQFKQQIKILTSGKYHVLPLPQVVAALANDTPLPPYTVAITMDDAYRSIYTRAFPLLKAAGLPFTVFVSTDAVGQVARIMTWDELRALEAAGVTIGAHGAAHAHMALADRGSDEEDLARMTQTFLTELGHVPKIFAYPYGEYSSDLVAMVKDAGYVAAFGQHSGAAVAGENMFTLPRFPLNEHYGTPDRFVTYINTLPLPVTDVLPGDMLLQPDSGAANPPAIGFTVAASVGPLDGLACYASDGATVQLNVLGGRRVEVRLDRPFPPGRSRVNCTLPTNDGRYRWLGLPFLVPGGSE